LPEGVSLVDSELDIKKLKKGLEVEFLITEPSNKSFDKLTIDDVDQTELVKNLKFSLKVEKAHKIEVSFKQKLFYVVTFDLDGGTVVEGSVAPVTIEAGKSLESLPVASKEGFEFDGWYLGEEKYVIGPVNSNIDLVARYKAITYQVTFKFEGVLGESSEEHIVTYNEGEELLYIGKPKSDQIFSYWVYEDERAPFGSPVTKSMVINAVYEKTHVCSADYIITSINAIATDLLLTDVVTDEILYYYSISEMKYFEVKIAGIEVNKKVVEYAQKGETAGLILEFVSEAPIELTKQDIIFANDKAPIVNKFKALISLPGREHPAFNGYRPQVKFYSVFQTGTMVFEEPDMIMPEDVDILVTVELNEGIMMPIIYGSKLLLYEGGKQVGHIIIVDDRE